MKTVKHFLPFLFSLVAMTVFLSSCSSDDDGGPIADPASAISGDYIGNGRLDYLETLTLERYSGMKVRVTKSSNEYVIVTPYYANNNPFFTNSGSVFKITQSAKGDFMLTSEQQPQTQILITKGGHMTYNNPYVSIDNENGYSLVFEGDKQK